MRNVLVAGAGTAPFAHLLPGSRNRAERRRLAAEGPDRKDPDDKDKDTKKGKAEETDDKDKKKEPDDPKKETDPDGKKAESDDDDKKKDDEEKEAKRAKKAEEEEKCDEEDDDDDEIASAARSGRRAATARCRNIFSAAAAGARPDVAAQLAFHTDLPSAQAVGILNAMVSGEPIPAPQARGGGLYAAMETRRTPNPGAGSSGAAGTGDMSFADQMKAATALARPEPAAR